MHPNNRSLSNVRVDIVIKHWYESIPTLLDREKNVVHVLMPDIPHKSITVNVMHWKKHFKEIVNSDSEKFQNVEGS